VPQQLTQSALSTQYIQAQVTVQSPDGYNPTADTVQMAFIPETYPPTQPTDADWVTGSWETFPGPTYWAQALVGPENGGTALTVGMYEVWVKVTDSPEVPVLQPALLEITP
jgi:hypothetical protein